MLDFWHRFFNRFRVPLGPQLGSNLDLKMALELPKSRPRGAYRSPKEPRTAQKPPRISEGCEKVNRYNMKFLQKTTQEKNMITTPKSISNTCTSNHVNTPAHTNPDFKIFLQSRRHNDIKLILNHVTTKPRPHTRFFAHQIR